MEIVVQYTVSREEQMCLKKDKHRIVMLTLRFFPPQNRYMLIKILSSDLLGICVYQYVGSHSLRGYWFCIFT